jgi:two-component system response regulator
MNRSPILLVEDNDDDVALTRRAFKRNNITSELVVCRDGAEALAHLADPARELPAVVLLDLNLPKVDGREVLRRLRADPRTRLLHVVVLTSSKEEQDVVQSYAVGANSYIRKPVDFDQFVQVVGQLGLYWLLLNEPVPR